MVRDIGTNFNDSRPSSPLPPIFDEYITPGGVSVIRNLKSNQRINDGDSTIIQIYSSKESTPVRMRRRSDSGQRRQSGNITTFFDYFLGVDARKYSEFHEKY